SRTELPPTPVILPAAAKTPDSAMMSCPRRGSNSTGTASSSYAWIRRRHERCTTRRCRKKCLSRRSSVPCAGQSFARCALPKTSARWLNRQCHCSIPSRSSDAKYNAGTSHLDFVHVGDRFDHREHLGGRLIAVRRPACQHLEHRRFERSRCLTQ